MDTNKEQLDALTEIRSIMERSSRFISLSGFSGVFAGLYALIGAGVAYSCLKVGTVASEYSGSQDGLSVRYSDHKDLYTFFFIDALCVLAASLLTGYVLTSRRARKQGHSVWDSTAKRLLINLLLPLSTGGLFCLIMLGHGLAGFVAPSMLIFYGLSLLNASKYTLNDIRYLGICEIALGLISAVYIGYGLLFWAIGFGGLHIVYGTLMYYRYER